MLVSFHVTCSLTRLPITRVVCTATRANNTLPGCCSLSMRRCSVVELTSHWLPAVHAVIVPSHIQWGYRLAINTTASHIRIWELHIIVSWSSKQSRVENCALLQFIRHIAYSSHNSEILGPRLLFAQRYQYQWQSNMSTCNLVPGCWQLLSQQCILYLESTRLQQQMHLRDSFARHVLTVSPHLVLVSISCGEEQLLLFLPQLLSFPLALLTYCSFTLPTAR